MMREDPELWNDLLSWVARTTGTFLRGQVMAGASAVQLFDSWAGALSLDEYLSFARPYSAAVLDRVSDLPVPRVHFGTRTQDLLVAMRDAGATVMGVDQYTRQWKRIETYGARVFENATQAASRDVLKANSHAVENAPVQRPATRSATQ